MNLYGLKYKSIVQFITEGGNAVISRHMNQDETKAVYRYTQEVIFPLLGLSGEGIDAAVIGSYGKKTKEMLSGDIDVAISADVVAAKNNVPFDKLLDFISSLLKKNGYETYVSVGFKQVSVAIQIPGTTDYGQVDLMLSTNLEWSKFIYHSPNFINAESKYKGLFRNILLMSIISESKKKIEKQTDVGNTEEYSQYAIRLESGVFRVRKTYLGHKGNLVKTAKLLHDYDKFVTNTPEEVVKLAFGSDTVPGDIMTFESIWAKFISNDFIHKEFREKIITRFMNGIKGKFPIPAEVAKEFPNIY